MIDRNLLCYVSPLPLVPNRFINVCKNKLRIFDGDLNICLEKECPIDFAEQSTVDGVRTSDSYTQYQPVFSGGRIYIQVRSSVYEYVGDQVIFLDKIPNFNMKTAGYYYGRLFSLNDQLFGSDTEGGIYQLVNDRFKHVRPGKYGYYFNFCGQTLIWYLNDRICKLQPDFTITETSVVDIIKTPNTFRYISGCQSGIAVIHSAKCEQVILLDILSGQFSMKNNNNSFEVLRIGSIVELKNSGIILESNQLQENFGPHKQSELVEQFAIFFYQQQQQSGFRKQEWQELKYKLSSTNKLCKQLQCDYSQIIFKLTLKNNNKIQHSEEVLQKMKDQVVLLNFGQNQMFQLVQRLFQQGVE
ncbi:Conserved_hypothetical protein [Hexamita inflata]|uniref:Uncharacterized protein n=1 Tax=Hexamita inflata TaxID=28002 RepID=A0AA86UII2_9EUKA|nr:Conserved hypothetical protein [Hexamita inflata]